jgi:group I intron endonuclease
VSDTTNNACEAIGKMPIENESQILTDTTPKKTVGIYGLRCKINGKWYIGKTKNHIPSRWSDYKCLRCERQPKIYNALIKYGYDNFDKIIIESGIIDEVTLNLREIYWIKYHDSFHSGYNLTEGGCSETGKSNKGRKLTVEHRRKMSLTQTGRKHSEETKRKISLSHKGKKRSKFSNEHRKNLSMSGKEKGIGKDNPSFGKRWITNGVENKLVDKNLSVLSEWRVGRMMDTQKGKKRPERSKEWCKNMSIAQKNSWEKRKRESIID